MLRQVRRLRGLATFAIHLVTYLSFTSDGQELITTGLDGIIWWNTNTWLKVRSIDTYPDKFTLSKDEQLIAYSTGSLSIASLSDDLNIILDIPYLGGGKTSSISFGTSNDFVVLSTGQGKAYLINSSDGSIKSSLFLGDECVEDEWGTDEWVSLIGDDDLLATACGPKVEIRNIDSGDLLWELDLGKENYLQKLKLTSSPLNEYFVISYIINNLETNVLIIDSGSFETVYEFNFDTLPWCNGIYDPDSNFIDFLVKQWGPNSYTYRNLSNFEIPDRDGFYMPYYSISSDKDMIAYILNEMRAYGRNILYVYGKSGNFEEPIVDYMTSSQASGNTNEYAGLHAPVFNPNGSHISVATNLHILTWNTSTGDLVSDINLSPIIRENHNLNYYKISGMVYRNNDELIFIGSDTGIHLADTNAGSIIGTASTSFRGNHVALSPDGSQLAIDTCGNFRGPGVDPFSERIIVLFGISDNAEITYYPNRLGSLVSGSYLEFLSLIVAPLEDGKIVVDNSSGKYFEGGKTRFYSIKAPFSVQFKLDSRSSLFYISGRSTDPNPSWWGEGIKNLYFSPDGGMTFYDGRSETSNERVEIGYQGEEIAYTISFLDNYGKQFDLFNENGKFIGHYDVTKFYLTDFPDGLFPDGVVSFGIQINPGGWVSMSDLKIIIE